MRQRYRFGWRCSLALYFSYAPNHGTPAEFTSFLHVFLLNFTNASKDEYAKSVRTHSFNKHLCFLVLSAMIWYIYISIYNLPRYICKLSLYRFLSASKQIPIWASGHLIVKLHQIKHFRTNYKPTLPANKEKKNHFLLVFDN